MAAETVIEAPSGLQLRASTARERSARSVARAATATAAGRDVGLDLMRGLAMVRPSEFAASADTILTLFEPDAAAPVPELTPFDMAYLKGLYSIQGRRWARQQVRQLADAIAGESEQATP